MAKNKQVVWTDLAFQEYEETIDWLLANWALKIAISFSELMDQKVLSIKKQSIFWLSITILKGLSENLGTAIPCFNL